MANQSLYLPGDVLTVQCESAITTGIVMETIEKLYLGRCGASQSTTNIDYPGNEERLNFPTKVLKEHLKSLYSDGYLSDVKLKTKTATFPVHKPMLGACSGECHRLYIAADKYEILSLKDEFSSFLKLNLTPTEACEILILVDLHMDGDLKTCVQNFIVEHDKEIFDTDDWNKIIETNPKTSSVHNAHEI
ncbi:TD and POZ domain-containing protein 5 [Caerostris extrusa]|uniref:TD and POZ domain-containing protein 5 n=1 Tax=Caerostris extrusa TaxID=172846 RepID=A0AAV4SX51_CAEEX|nr:TD and POZ domain-containing protein 5 [Caerostris extrusa]